MQPEDTLYSIAWRHDIDFKDLAAWNNLGPSMRIEPGQILVLNRAHSVGPAADIDARAHRDIPRLEKPKPFPDLGRPSGAVPSTAWVWPTRAFTAPTPVAGGGVLILGAVGQDIVAAAAGKVVYVGSGLRGYGNLVIIKHSDTLLSAYAHNRELSVREGQMVKSGARIGAMGLGPRQIPSLYFEIRFNGKPVDVSPYLGKR